jgi:hypothetical protein
MTGGLAASDAFIQQILGHGSDLMSDALRGREEGEATQQLQATNMDVSKRTSWSDPDRKIRACRPFQYFSGTVVLNAASTPRSANTSVTPQRRDRALLG